MSEINRDRYRQLVEMMPIEQAVQDRLLASRSVSADIDLLEGLVREARIAQDSVTPILKYLSILTAPDFDAAAAAPLVTEIVSAGVDASKLGNFEVALGLFDIAVDFFLDHEALDVQVGVFVAQVNRGVCFMNSQNIDRAMIVFDEVSKGASIFGIERISAFVMSRMVNFGYKLLENGDFSRAIKMFKWVNRVTPGMNAVPIQQNRAQSWIGLSEAYKKSEKPNSEIKVLRQIADHFGRSSDVSVLVFVADARIRLAEAYVRKLDYDAAIGEYHKNIDEFLHIEDRYMEEQTSITFLNLVRTLGVTGRYDAANRFCDIVLRRVSDAKSEEMARLQIIARYNKGAVLSNLGNFEEALQYIEDVIHRTEGVSHPDLLRTRTLAMESREITLQKMGGQNLLARSDYDGWSLQT